jgi:hypothetical protein
MDDRANTIISVMPIILPVWFINLIFSFLFMDYTLHSMDRRNVCRVAILRRFGEPGCDGNTL